MADVKLNLTPGRESPLTPLLILNFLFFLLPKAFITLPCHLIWHYIINRRNSALVQVIGRPWWGDIMIQLGRYILTRSSVAQSRIIFDRVKSYKIALHKSQKDFKGRKDWLSYVSVNGTAGRWTAPPGTRRSEDEVVMFYCHGGGFVIDTGGDAQILWMKLAQEMNVKRNVQFSVFSLDYRLAPDMVYPSQLIELLAGYHYLVNTCGISEDKICISGDSAGGNLVAAFLLHLARPNPAIRVPSSLGPTPRRPGSAFLISPWVKLFSTSASIQNHELFDYIEMNAATYAALDYLGIPTDFGKAMSWNPLHILYKPAPPQDRKYLPVKGAQATTAANEGKGIDLLRSPFVNPSACEDLEWLAEAYPGEGRTMFAWGGKECLNDDIVEFIDKLDVAGVASQRLCKPLGVHDWILFDYSIHGAYITKTTGPSRELSWGMEQLADFLQDVDVRVRKNRRESKRKAGPEVEEVLAPVAAATPAPKSGRRHK